MAVLFLHLLATVARLTGPGVSARWWHAGSLHGDSLLRGWCDVLSGLAAFLINIALEEATAPLTVVLNWQAGLKK